MYPLRTRNSIAFDRWLICYEFMRQGKHLSHAGALELKSIAAQINNDTQVTYPAPSKTLTIGLMINHN